MTGMGSLVEGLHSAGSPLKLPGSYRDRPSAPLTAAIGWGADCLLQVKMAGEADRLSPQTKVLAIDPILRRPKPPKGPFASRLVSPETKTDVDQV